LVKLKNLKTYFNKLKYYYYLINKYNKMAGMIATTDRIVAMSYNVCFGCMYSDANSAKDLTSQTLAQHCVNTAIAQKKNVCLGNIQTVFQNAELEFGPLDLVGIQESTNWD
jgi:hypothetical protein